MHLRLFAFFCVPSKFYFIKILHICKAYSLSFFFLVTIGGIFFLMQFLFFLFIFLNNINFYLDLYQTTLPNSLCCSHFLQSIIWGVYKHFEGEKIMNYATSLIGKGRIHCEPQWMKWPWLLKSRKLPYPHTHPEVTQSTPAEQEMNQNKELITRDDMI